MRAQNLCRRRHPCAPFVTFLAAGFPAAGRAAGAAAFIWRYEDGTSPSLRPSLTFIQPDPSSFSFSHIGVPADAVSSNVDDAVKSNSTVPSGSDTEIVGEGDEDARNAPCDFAKE